MEKEFVPYQPSFDLKELGFDEPCFKGYTEEYKILINFSNTHTNISVKNTLPTKPFTAPLYQQAFRWFREKYGVFGEINLTTKQEDVKAFEFFVLNIEESLFESKDYETYEEAELECLKKLIEIVKEK